MLRRRAQVRINQQRYRLKLHDTNTARVRDVVELTQDIARCQGRIEILTRSVLRLHEPEVGVVLEYFRLFRSGYAPRLPHLHEQQVAFVNAVMEPNLIFQGEARVEKLWEQWRLSHVLFSTYEMEPARIDSVSVEATTVLRVSTTIRLGLTWRSVTALFPQAADHPHLARRLVGQVLLLPLVHHFHFNESRRVVQLDTMAATPIALSNLLGNLDDTVTC
ncbi:hypothetical protein SPRG_16171 [Saprolegnia parasitica CBS 223.65]|uniref:Uncharacterized protein n=1 Tax=Saprolegnia parasitica (strain CBS 223.65) TaxID=695850 RepID=A0A067BP06_SAPPC|nr:hypothetical protein SPRG_16171 [Saprolegnia parasitica CBS 223.65]KDO18495.1 hypothetical protein SPRG_16171 [Saprolegnia parasitica CBS 223.65]|eukprot:XP_012210790.1 hypothetical protein SPRG_16171 [Saprolegnia parasitica CBS 223.65]